MRAGEISSLSTVALADAVDKKEDEPQRNPTPDVDDPVSYTHLTLPTKA